MITKITIKNFRAIKEQSFNSKELSIFIGNNGTGKTSIIETINYVLSPYFLSGRLKHTDFFNGNNEPIIIQIEFDSIFTAILPDGDTTQKVECKKQKTSITSTSSFNFEQKGAYAYHGDKKFYQIN